MKTKTTTYRLPTRTIDLSTRVPSELTRDLTPEGREALADAILAGEKNVTVTHFPKKTYRPNPGMRAAIARLPIL